MKHYSPIITLHVLLAVFLLTVVGGAWGAPAAGPLRILRDGQARYDALDPAKLPPGTSPALFPGVVSGKTFELFVRDLDAQALTLEIGFVDTQSQGPQQNTLSLSANGTPLDANLDVWSKAGGAYKPWILKTTFSHPGGSLAIQFTGVSSVAFVSFLRISDTHGNVLAFGTASDWQKGERLTLLDSRSTPFHRVAVGSVPFFNVDHSPVGSWSTFLYGMTASGGVQVCKQPGGLNGTLVPHEGVIVAAKNGPDERIMPFASPQKSLPEGAVVNASEVTRTLGACTDSWQMPMGVSWTHYTPVWAMKDWDKASAKDKRRFTLPVTWMRYRIDNSSGKQETQLLFSLEQPAQRAQGLAGFDGYVVDTNSLLAVRAGDADLLTEDQARQEFNVDGATSAFRVHVAPGTVKEVTFYVVQYQPGVVAHLQDQPMTLMCDSLYKDTDDILKTASASFPAVISRCQDVDAKLSGCGQDAERQFLAADTLHSYQYNTVLYAGEHKKPVWTVIEGECSCINTFDLTVDMVFYELAMHPWTVRNELDNYARIFSYTDELSLPGQTARVPGGIGFWHDMGTRTNFSNRKKGAAYSTLMTQEELQNWILCATLYWKTTGDNAWLERNKDVFERALKSMQLRDDVDPAKRDGITTYVSNIGTRSGEITTYDAMDASLHFPEDSLYIAVKSFACYTMLKPVFAQLGEAALAQQAQDAEAYTVKGISSHWDAASQSFPAVFNDNAHSSSSIIPAIEGLAYPYVMGLRQDVSPDGPNAELIGHLKTHLETILKPGVCLDAHTGAWNLSSSSSTTWVSKVYLNQFVAENVLGVKNADTGSNADAAHYAYEVLGASAVCWTDQFFTDSHVAFGCRHYPRGVTSALWWLWPSLNGTSVASR